MALKTDIDLAIDAYRRTKAASVEADAALERVSAMREAARMSATQAHQDHVVAHRALLAAINNETADMIAAKIDGM